MLVADAIGLTHGSSRNVLVEGCFVDVGDDTVAIKSGMDFAGRQFAHPSENIIFRNCHFVQNAMSIGSEESGGVRNVTFENIVMGPRHEPYTEGKCKFLRFVFRQSAHGEEDASVLNVLFFLHFFFQCLIVHRSGASFR